MTFIWKLARTNGKAICWCWR